MTPTSDLLEQLRRENARLKEDIRRLLGRALNLMDERDKARDLACRLEAECARLEGS